MMNSTTTDIRDMASLLAAIHCGRPLEYIFFWGHGFTPGQRVGKECLSQWYPASFTVDGVLYRSAEHFMMAGKAHLFGDAAALARILAAPTPAAVKKIGRTVQGFDLIRWQATCLDVVIQGNVEKFRQNPELLEYLLGTADHVLVEASPTDRIWGIGLHAEDPLAANPEKWRGTNLLGFALMAARATLAGIC